MEHDLDPWPLLTEGEHIGVRLGERIADELLLSSFDGAPLAGLCDVHGGAGTIRATGAGGSRVTRALALLFQLPLEPLDIHLHSALARDDLRQVDGKPEGVVELERLFTGDGPRAGGEDLLQPAEPAVDGLEESTLLGLRHLLDITLLGDQLVIDTAKLLDDDRSERGQGRLATAEQPGVADRAPEDPAEDVAPTLIARIHAVGQQEAHGTRMIGQHAVGGAVFARAIVWCPHQFADPIDQRRKRSEWKLSSSPCITAAMRSRPAPVSTDGLGSGVSVPSAERSNCMKTRFQISRNRPASASRSNSSWGMTPPVPRPAWPPLQIHEDFGARTAGPGIAHLPEVVLVAETVDPVVGKPGHLAPEVPRLLVGMVDGDPEPIGRDAEIRWAGHELPGVRDRLALEVVAKGEVAQHLEEGVMPLGVADLLEIVMLAAGPDALLAGGGPGVVALLLAQERALELHHAGVREKQRRIVGGDQ